MEDDRLRRAFGAQHVEDLGIGIAVVDHQRFAGALGQVDVPGEGLTLLRRMLAIAMLASLASFVGATWLTRSALEPVQAIARQAEEIEAGRTGHRITAHTDVIELRELIEAMVNEADNNSNGRRD